MLFVDPSEVRDDTKLCMGDVEYTVVPGLEEMTGADFMVSALDAPATTEPLVHMHLRHKAVLVQRKHRMDLVSSLEDRLKSSLYKMRSFGARQSQCSLLFIGILTCDRDGRAQIDGQDTGRPFWAVYAGLSVWIKYGGVVEPPLSRATLFPDWVKFKTRHIRESLSEPVKEFIPSMEPVYEIDPDDPVQELVMVKDWRATAMCCPGWGIKRINAMRAVMLERGAPDTLSAAIVYMTTPTTHVPGVGKGMIDKARKWAGVE